MNEEQIKIYVDKLNKNKNSKIKFKYEFEEQKTINFLDTTLFIDVNK